MYKFLTLLTCLVCFTASIPLAAQNIWTATSEQTLKKNHSAPLWNSDSYRTISLNWQQLKAVLDEAPLRFTAEAAMAQVILPIPMPDGQFHNFRITEVLVMHEVLGSKFPMIKTYAGTGIEDPSASIRLDISTFGFHAMVLSTGHSPVFINPYSRSNQEDYISFYKKSLQTEKHTASFECSFDEYNSGADYPEFQRNAGDCQFRTYELALSCTIEYAAFHGGTLNSAISAMVVTMNRVNGIFERDAGHTMVMVPDNDQLIFINSDNFSNGDGGAMLGQNQTVCDNIIGFNNYDIGHVFSTGGGGVAYLRSPCGGSKAGGVTGQGAPVGDPFDIDYVAHEMGHQYGGNHTQNNSCNRNGNTAIEPGSASTIMGYAGICSPNVQSNSDAYFHGISMLEIGNFTSSANGNCGQITNTNNNQPTADAGADYNIPVATPFTLTGTAQDSDGDQLTYCWEQIDNETATMPPVSGNTSGPAFRSFDPLGIPARTFPDMSAILANTTPTWEVLPSAGRSMNFQFTVRDNNTGYGCSAEDYATVNTINNIGPFLVTEPNISTVIWPTGATETVSWDVAGTDGGAVNCANVDILLSVDGGLSYPTTLATNVPNNGSYEVLVPQTPTTNARIMIICSDNIFFDISNQNFTIELAAPDYTLDVTPATIAICSPDDAGFNIYVGTLGGFTDLVDLTVTGNPEGTTTTLSNSSVAPESTITLTIGNTSSAMDGTYNIEITGNSSTGPKTISANLILASMAPSAPIVNIPLNGTIGISGLPNFGWQDIPGTTAYTIEISDSINFSNIIESATTTNSTYTATTLLDPNTMYYWNVSAVNFCGPGAITTSGFTTAEIQCNLTYSNNQAISISQAGSNTYVSTINISESGIITDVNLTNLNIMHTYTGDLEATLTSPMGTAIALFNQPGVPASQFGCAQDNVLLNFDDDANNTSAVLEGTCNASGGNFSQAISGDFQPIDLLATLNGENISGDWLLTFTDNADQDGGTFQGWALDICIMVEAALPVELLTFNARPADKTIVLNWETTAEVNNRGFEVLRSVAPDKGFEKTGWVDSKNNNSFTQSYIYIDRDVIPGVDYYYKLRQVDMNGHTTDSRIVSAILKKSIGHEFYVYPNPAKNACYLFYKGVGNESHDIRIFNMEGKLIHQTSVSEDRVSGFAIDTGNYPPGVYMVSLTGPDFHFNQKLIVE